MSPRIHVLFLGKAHLPDISENDVLAVYIDEYPPQLVDTSDVGATLDSIRAQFTDATFTCSPDLATLAEPHGFVVEPWHPQMLAARAALALKVTYAPRLDDVNPALLASLLKAAARLNTAKKDADRFWRATEHLAGSDGNSRLAVDVAVIAATSPLFDQNNLTLFASREDADEYYRSVTPWKGTNPTVRLVTLDLAELSMPAVQEAVRAYTGSHIVPAVFVDDRGREDRLSDLECAVLAASTFALADLAEAPDRVDSATSYGAAAYTFYAQLHVELNQVASGKYRGSMGWWR
jgi:hypothetical protein